jgi:predicted enzyme related to lactoylglutathione lyase
MNQVRVEQKTYQMPPQDGFTVAHFLTVVDIERSRRFYETVFGGRFLSRGERSGAPEAPSVTAYILSELTL